MGWGGYGLAEQEVTADMGLSQAVQAALFCFKLPPHKSQRGSDLLPSWLTIKPGSSVFVVQSVEFSVHFSESAPGAGFDPLLGSVLNSAVRRNLSPALKLDCHGS